MFDGRERSRGAGDKEGSRAGLKLGVLDMIFDFGREVDDVAEAGGLLGDLLCVNSDHATAGPSAMRLDQTRLKYEMCEA